MKTAGVYELLGQPSYVQHLDGFSITIRSKHDILNHNVKCIDFVLP